MAYRPKVKQVANPFGVKPAKIDTKTTKYNKTKYSKNKSSGNYDQKSDDNYVDISGSGDQSPSDWVSVKSTTFDNASKPTYSYSTNKPPKKYKITPKNKALPKEPNGMWHSQPKQDPSATVCPVCTKKLQKNYILVDGYKVNKGCFKCAKCGKLMDHTKPSTYTKVN